MAEVALQRDANDLLAPFGIATRLMRFDPTSYLLFDGLGEQRLGTLFQDARKNILACQ